MIIGKSKKDLEKMRAAGRLAAEVREALRRMARPGITTLELDAAAERMIRDAGALPTFKGYHKYPYSICASVNEQVVHGFPTNREDCRRGYVLDGFPRTTAQAAMLEKLAVEQGNRIQAVLVDTPADVLEKRATGRRTCPVCGEIYNVYFKPPRREGFCDLHPDAELVRRADDTAEKIRVRLETYEEQTRPLLDYYERSHRLRRVDGTREVEEIYADIEKIVTGEP